MLVGVLIKHCAIKNAVDAWNVSLAKCWDVSVANYKCILHQTVKVTCNCARLKIYYHKSGYS